LQGRDERLAWLDLRQRNVRRRDPRLGRLLELRLQGSLGDTALVFDRNTFLIMPKQLASGDIAGLANSEIFTFDADDNNSGFLPVMKFARGAYPDQKVVLTEKTSKAVSTQTGHVGTREKTTTTFRKAYHYQRLGWTDAPEADVAMDCIEYMLSAP
jgi:hypothetical protein